MRTCLECRYCGPYRQETKILCNHPSWTHWTEDMRILSPEFAEECYSFEEKKDEMPFNLSRPMQTALLFAARYTHDRNTGGTLAVVTALKQYWQKIDDQTKVQIIRESHEATTNLDDWQSLREFSNEKGKDND